MTPLLADTLGVAVAAIGTLLFDHTEVRLDTLREDDAPVTVWFPFTVGGTASVTLVDGWTSCPCTRLVDYPQRTLAAGDTGSVAVRFHPAGQEGEVVRVVTLYGREAPGVAVAELMLSACVIAPADEFYAYRVRRDPLRLMRDSLTLSTRRGRTSLLVANVHAADTLVLTLAPMPDGLASPVAATPLWLPPRSAGSVEIALDTAAVAVTPPQVSHLHLYATPHGHGMPAPVGCPVDLTVTVRTE